MSNDLKPETMLYVPIVQECEGGGVERWIEIPAAGKVADDYKFPAPASSCFPRSEPDQDPYGWMAGHRVRPFSAVALNAVRVILLVAFTWFGAGAAATGAAAHASLVMTSPAEGAVLQAAPQEFSLTFSEPVSPLSLNLIGPDGSKRALSGFTLKDKTLAITAPPALARGTHVLSWRVVSEDGHPVGGSVVFSSGEPSATPPAIAPSADRAVMITLWSARLGLALGLFLGVGGAAFAAWAGALTPIAKTVSAAFLTIGLASVPLALAMQGLDSLEVPLSSVFQRAIWQAGLASSFATTLIVAGGAMALALGSLAIGGAVKLVLAMTALLGVGLALSAAATRAPHRHSP